MAYTPRTVTLYRTPPLLTFPRSLPSKPVFGVLAAVNGAVDELVISQLQTPIGIYPSARVRVDDIISATFDVENQT